LAVGDGGWVGSSSASGVGGGGGWPVCGRPTWPPALPFYTHGAAPVGGPRLSPHRVGGAAAHAPSSAGITQTGGA